MKKSFLIAFITTITVLTAIFFFEPKPKQEPDVVLPPAPVEPEPEIKEFNLHPVAFEDLSNWKNDDLTALINAFKLSCDRIKFEKNEFLSNAQAKIPTKIYQKICADFNAQNSQEFKTFIENNFTPYKVIYKGAETGKFTSYYEAAINASRTKNGQYQYPIYGKPRDLIEFNIKDFDDSLPSKRYVGRIKENKLIPYYTRKEIETGNVDAPVLLWGDSLVDIHVMQIQGSAVAKLDTGESIRISYADNNGLPFRGIGSILLERKLIKAGQANMGSIKKWLKENQELGVESMQENKRYVFFQLNTDKINGPIGAHNVPLTNGRSLAVDREFIPLGALLWLETDNPKFEKTVIAQDIGSAIKGGIRGDYFWGSGGDDVLELAGKMNSAGRYFIFLPKNMD